MVARVVDVVECRRKAREARKAGEYIAKWSAKTLKTLVLPGAILLELNPLGMLLPLTPLNRSPVAEFSVNDIMR